MSFIFPSRLAVLVQRYRTGLLVAGCGSLVSINLLYHVFPEHTYRKVYQAWEQGRPQRLSRELDDTFRDVLQDMGVTQASHTYSAFSVYGFEPVVVGLPCLPYGAQVGIPENFNWDRESVADRTLLVEGEAVQWDCSTGLALKEALLLSPPAQRFALACEVARLEVGAPLMEATLGPVCLVGACAWSVGLKQLWGLYSGPALLRFMVNTLALALGAVSYLLSSDALTKHLELRCDQRAAKLSQEYAHGGVEYYDKILSRNRTLRKLLGKKGEQMYSPNGNQFPTSMFRMKHTPYTARKEQVGRFLKQGTV